MEIIQSIASIIFWFLIIVLPLVVIHEFGHLLFARLFGVRVIEYGVGVPPRIVFKRWKGIIWSINYLMLGGFVRIYGDNDALDRAKQTQKSDSQASRDNYIIDRTEEILNNRELEFFLEENNLKYNQSWQMVEKYGRGKPNLSKLEEQVYLDHLKQLETLVDWEYDSKINSRKAFFSKNLAQQIFILLGGIIFNLLTAVSILFIVFAFLPISRLGFSGDIARLDPSFNIQRVSGEFQVLKVTKNMPAYQAGFRGGDSLVSIAGQQMSKIEHEQDFAQLLSDNNGKEIDFVFKKKATGETVKTKLTPNKTECDGSIGISAYGHQYKVSSRNISHAFRTSITTTFEYFIGTFKSIGQIFKALLPQAENKCLLTRAVGGPVAVGSYGSMSFKFGGLNQILSLMAMISIALAAFNLLPIPALDGGRIIIVILNKITGKRNKNLEALVINTTLLILLGLAIIIAFNDVKNILSGR